MYTTVPIYIRPHVNFNQFVGTTVFYKMSSFNLNQNIPEAILDGIFSKEDLVDSEESKGGSIIFATAKVWTQSTSARPRIPSFLEVSFPKSGGKILTLPPPPIHQLACYE